MIIKKNGGLLKLNYTILKNIRKFNKIILIFGILFICFSIQTKSIKAEENNVIKVGCPIVEGFTEIKDGVYSGYAYEYLREIAKYTGWEILCLPYWKICSQII